MAKLGDPIVYRVAEAHRTTTVRDDPATGKQVELEGSIHHPECSEFAGIIGRVHEVKAAREVGRYDILIFPPNRDPKWINGVAEGHGDDSFELVVDED